MTLRVKLLTGTAKAPTRATDFSAGFDLYADEDCCLDACYDGARKAVCTGVAVAIDPGKVGLIWPRSGMAAKLGIDTGAGVIDSDYRGEVKVLLFNHGSSPVEIRRGDRIAQLLIVPVYGQSVEVVDELDDTGRGGKGFGSSGK